jgi:hypothetical protein
MLQSRRTKTKDTLMPITLPEITIVGDPGASPSTAGDWFAEGFMFGWNHPDTANPEAPAPLREDLLSAYDEGARAGRNARRGIETDYADYDGPAVDVDPGGEPYEEAEKRWKEAWDEFLNHREDPHLDPKELRFGD